MRAGKFLAVVVLSVFFVVSCKQDPILYIIATETAPVKPLIEGAPTNMVVFKRNGTPVMYAASGRLHWYAKSSDGITRWNSDEYAIPQPGGKIISLAATDDCLYVLSLDGHGVKATLRYIESNGNEWKTVSSEADGYPLIQAIYADYDFTSSQTTRLFAGAGKNDRSQASYAILYLDNAAKTLKMLKSDTSIFSGVVYQGDTYYLCTQGDGIYSVSETALANNAPSVSKLSVTGDASVFMGMIKLKDNTVIAVARNGGGLFREQSGSFVRMTNSSGNNISTGKYATGALALWEHYEDPTNKLLIAGIQGGLYSTSISSYTHGYVEFILNPSDGSLNIEESRRDPGKLKSVNNQDRYMASLGKHPINHLFQAPRDIDPNMTFFASTQTEGLWSYRDRSNNGGWQWNAEPKK